MPEELSSWGNPIIPSTGINKKPLTDVQFQKLVNEVQADQTYGATDFDRATKTRADLFSRLRFPKSSNGVKIKQD